MSRARSGRGVRAAHLHEDHGDRRAPRSTAGLPTRALLAAGKAPDKVNVAFFVETKPTMIAKGEGWFEKMAGRQDQLERGRQRAPRSIPRSPPNRSISASPSAPRRPRRASARTCRMSSSASSTISVPPRTWSCARRRTSKASPISRARRSRPLSARPRISGCSAF